MVKNAALVVSGPISIIGLYEGVSDEMKKKGVAIHEYDVDTNLSHLCGTVLQMGLSNEASGIMFKKSKNYSWDMISSERLREVVLEKGEMKPSNSKQVYLCYVQEPPHAYRFLNRTVAFCYKSQHMEPGNKGYEATMLDNPKKLAEQANQFAQILEKERSFNHVFHGTINRKLYL